MSKAILWSNEDKEKLKVLFNDPKLKTDDIAKILNKSLVQCRKQARRLGIKKVICDIWSHEEDLLLTQLWVKSEISTNDFIIPGKTKREMLLRVGKLELVRNPRVKQLAQIKRNKLNGRNLSDDELLTISKKYKTKSQFKLEDDYAYCVARNRGLLDSYSHLCIGVTFNYPQTALYEILKVIYKEYDILYNDRKAIYPKELDIYIPDLMYGFEYDGKNFHSEENDTLKNNICIAANIKLFRIKEMSKNNPIPDILLQLEAFDIDTSKILISEIKNSITKYYMDITDIKNIISEYTNIAKFRKSHGLLYRFLDKNDMLYLIEHIKPKEITENNIIECIESCNNKTEFYTKHKGMYLRLFKNKNIYKLAYMFYCNLIELPPKRKSKPKKLPKTNRKSTEHTCPHCNKVGKGNVMFVHHFNKCKFKL